MPENHSDLLADPARMLRLLQVQTELARLELDLGEVMAVAAERAQELTRASGAVVELAEGEEMVYRAASDSAASQLGLRIPRTGSLSGLCVAENRVLACHDSESDPRVNREACRLVGLRSMLVVPLVHGDTVIGVLKVMAAQPHAFHAAEEQVLGAMAGLIASTIQRAAEPGTRALFHRATHDDMTGLANRALFHDRLRKCHACALRGHERFAVVSIDMDGLKRINDSCGHRAGDAALIEFARRLKVACRQEDTVARLGGDEFGMLLTGVEGRDAVQAASRRYQQHIQPAFEFEGHELALRASFGIAMFPDDGQTLEQLLECADQAMYKSKRVRHAEPGAPA